MVKIDEMRLFALKVALAYWVMFTICLYGVKVALKEVKRIKKIIFRYLALLAIGFGIFVTVYMSYSITIDVIKYDYKVVTITVTKIDNNPGTKGGLFYSEIYAGENESYRNAYKKFRFTEGKTYEIKYLPRTRTIIDSGLKE